MKKMIMIASALLITGALSPAFAQEGPPTQAKVSAPAPALVTPVEVPQIPQVELATAAPAASSETVKPAAAIEAVKPAEAQLSACPHCFQPLLAGYSGIVAELRPWMEEMEVKAAAFDHRLSAIQKQINEKDDAIEKAKLGTDKKAMKAAVKLLTKEHKLLMKEYTMASEGKEAFYKKFSKEIEKKTERYDKIVESKLRETLSAASQ